MRALSPDLPVPAPVKTQLGHLATIGPPTSAPRRLEYGRRPHVTTAAATPCTPLTFILPSCPARHIVIITLPPAPPPQLYHYPNFHASRDGPRFTDELVHNLIRPTAWEAVMRIRCSKGLRISSFHGHFFNRSTDLLALPTCDPDKAFAVQISHEEAVVPTTVAYVQCALLYTNSNGERRIRCGAPGRGGWGLG